MNIPESFAIELADYLEEQIEELEMAHRLPDGRIPEPGVEAEVKKVRWWVWRLRKSVHTSTTEPT